MIKNKMRYKLAIGVVIASNIFTTLLPSYTYAYYENMTPDYRESRIVPLTVTQGVADKTKSERSEGTHSHDSNRDEPTFINKNRNILVLSHALIAVDTTPTLLPHDAIERANRIKQAGSNTEMVDRIEKEYKDKRVHQVASTLGVAEPIPYSPDIKWDKDTGHKIKHEHLVSIPLLEKEPIVRVRINNLHEDLKSDSVALSSGANYTYGNGGTPSVNPVSKSSTHSNQTGHIVNPYLKHPANWTEESKGGKFISQGNINPMEGYGEWAYVSNTRPSETRTSTVTGETLTKPITYTDLEYVVGAQLTLTKENRLGLKGELLQEIDDFRWNKKGSATTQEYENLRNKIRQEFLSHGIYRRNQKTYGQFIGNLTIPEEFIDALMVEDLNSIQNRVQIYTLLIPSLVTIEDTRYDRDKRYISSPGCPTRGTSNYDYTFFTKEEESIKTNKEQDELDPEYYYNFDNGEKELKVFKDYGLATEQSAPTKSVGKYKQYISNHLNQKVGILREPNPETINLGSLSISNYSEETLSNPKKKDITYKTLPNVNIPEPKPTESVYHKTRTLAPRITTPPNVVNGIPVEVIGYSKDFKSTVINTDEVMPEYNADSSNNKGIPTKINYGVPDSEIKINRNNIEYNKESSNEPDINIVVEYEPREHLNTGKPPETRGATIMSGYSDKTISDHIVIEIDYMYQGNKFSTLRYFIAPEKDSEGNVIGDETGLLSYKVPEELYIDKYIEYDLKKVKIDKNTTPMNVTLKGTNYGRATKTKNEILNEFNVGGLISKKATNRTNMFEYLLSPNGRIIYTYLDIFNEDNNVPIRTNKEDLQKQKQEERRKTIPTQRKEYPAVTEEIGTKEILGYSFRMNKPTTRYTQYITTSTIRFSDYTTLYGCVTSRSKKSKTEKKGVNIVIPRKYQPETAWSHRTEFKMQYHAAINNITEGLYDFNNPNNKTTKSGYGIFYEADADLRTDWPYGQTVVSTLTRSPDRWELNEKLTYNKGLHSRNINIGELKEGKDAIPLQLNSDGYNDFVKTNDGVKRAGINSGKVKDTGLAISKKPIIDPLQNRITLNSVNEKTNALLPYKDELGIASRGLAVGPAGDKVLIPTSYLWKNLIPVSKNNNLIDNSLKAPTTVPFEKTTHNFEQKMEWSTRPGFFFAYATTSDGKQIVPKFGNAGSRQHFIHPDYPNKEFEVQPRISVQFAPGFHVQYISRVSIPVNGNMFDDSFTTLER